METIKNTQLNMEKVKEKETSLENEREEEVKMIVEEERMWENDEKGEEWITGTEANSTEMIGVGKTRGGGFAKDYNYLLEEGKRQAKKNRNEEDSDRASVVSLSSEHDDGNARSRAARKRNRTGCGRFAVEKFSKRREDEQKRMENLEKKWRDREIAMRNRKLGERESTYRKETEGQKIEELRENPSVDLTVEAMEQASIINNVADISRNLKGTNVKILRDAATTIRAVVTILADRLQSGNPNVEEERVELSKLRKEIHELRRQKEENEIICTEIKVIKEERQIMNKEIELLKKLIQDLSNAPPNYPALAARKTADKPVIREIISIPVSQKEIQKDQEKLERQTRERTMYDKSRIRLANLEKPRDKEIDISRAVYKIKGGMGVRIKPNSGKDSNRNSGKRSKTGIQDRNTDNNKNTGKNPENKTGKPDDRNNSNRKRSVSNINRNASNDNLRRGNVNSSSRDREENSSRDKEENKELEEVPWSKVVGRREKRKEERKVDEKTAAVVKKETRIGNDNNSWKERRIKEPSTAAIIMDCAPGSYDEIMREARRKIRLQDVGIDEGMKCKRAITGATLFEIRGENREEKAKALEAKLRETFAGREEIKIYRPIKTMELKITEMEESTTRGEVVEAIVEQGNCCFTEVKIGGLRVNGRGVTTAWVKCPIGAASILSKKGRIRVGWTNAKVEVLGARPLQCYKCSMFGHVQQHCRENVDNRDRCYRCGEPGHRVVHCDAKFPKCIACKAKGRNSKHRMGGQACLEGRNAGRRPPERKRVTTEKPEERVRERTMDGNVSSEEDIRRPKRIKMEIGSDEEEERKGEEEPLNIVDS